MKLRVTIGLYLLNPDLLHGLILTIIMSIILPMLTCLPLKEFNLNPAIIEDVTQKGLDYVRSIGVPFVISELTDIPIPDVSGSTDTLIGKVSFGLSRIILSNVSVPRSNLTLTKSAGLTISAGDASVFVHTNWRYRQAGWPHIGDNGSCDMKMHGIGLSIGISIDRLAGASVPRIKATKCTFKVKKMKIRFHGGASWLYNIFANPIANDLKGTLEKMVSHGVITAINKEGSVMMKRLPEIIKQLETTMKDHQKNEIEDIETD